MAVPLLTLMLMIAYIHQGGCSTESENESQSESQSEEEGPIEVDASYESSQLQYVGGEEQGVSVNLDLGIEATVDGVDGGSGM